MSETGAAQNPAEQDAARHGFLVAGLIAALLYVRALGFGFVYDDVQVVLANPLLRSPGTLPETLVSPWWYQERHLYRPLSLLSLGIDWVLARGAPWLPHAENLVLHVALTVLVGRLAARWLPRRGAVAAALIFAVHPLHAEVVSTAVGRAEILCTLMLVGVALLASGDREPTPGARLGMAALAAAALGSKEVGVVAPALAFAAAWARPDQRGHAGRWTAAAALGVLPVLLARVAVLGTLGGDLPHPALTAGGWAAGVRLALSVLPRTLGALVVPGPAPIDLAPTLAESTAPDSRLVVLGAGLLALGLVALGRHLRKPSPATFGMWITATTLAPTANLLFPSGVVLAGRCLYAPSIGVALAGGVLATSVPSWPAPMRRATTVVALCWACAAAWWSVREVGAWRDADTLGAAMLARQPRSYRAHVYVAEVALTRGDARGALPHYRTAVGLFPNDGHQLYAAASTALVAGDTASAVPWLERAIVLAPDHWQARTRAVKVALARRDSAEARALLDEGLRRVPDQRAWRVWRNELGASN